MKDGYAQYCKECSAITHKEYYEKNKEKIITRTTKWYKENQPYKSAANREWHINRTYGLTKLAWNTLYELQLGVCAICEQPETRVSNKSGKVQPLCVDHKHDTKEVRALLCNRCNRVLGYIQDDMELAKKILTYLLKYN